MEKCKYCNIEYHPMPVWIGNGQRVHVCNMTIKTVGTEIEITQGSPCEEKAKADGYVKRLDLTPRR